MTNRHIAVIGGGVFGTWTAFHLLASGARVTLVDAYGPGNSRSSSGDESRIIRCGYGRDEIYSRFAARSLQLWKQFARDAGRAQAPLWHPCGVLWLGPPADPYVTQTGETLEAAGYPVERLDRRALHARYPQLNLEDIGEALLEPECGVIMARRAVALLGAELARRGVRIVRAAVRPGATGGTLDAVLTTDGTEIAADDFVFACGAWLPTVFAGLLAGRIRPTRQVVVYYGTPAGNARFGPAHVPAWVDFVSGIYGVPELEGRGLKVGIDAHGPAFDPDNDSRVVDAESIARTRAWLERRVPAMAAAPVVEARVCQYENTSTGDFLIDRHPSFGNVWIVGGGSGHGFKHGPAVGEYAARLMTGDGPFEPRFALASKAAHPERAVF